MRSNLKSLCLGVFIGVFFSFLIPGFANAKRAAFIERAISRFVHSLDCHTVDVQDIDLWEGKVLVKAKKLNISFIMTALDSASYEICPVGIGIRSLKEAPQKKK